MHGVYTESSLVNAKAMVIKFAPNISELELSIWTVKVFYISCQFHASADFNIPTDKQVSKIC